MPSQIEKYQSDLERLKRLYDALHSINLAIVRVRTPEELFQEVCRAAVERGGFLLASIRWYDAENKTLVPVAQCGYGDHELVKVKVHSDEPEGRGPTGLAYRKGEPYISNDYLGDPATAPFRAAAVQLAIRASAVFPVRLQNVVSGTFNVYAAEPGYFQSEEIALLEQAAADISFALDNFARDRERLRAEEIVRRLAAIVESTSDAILSITLDGTITSWNPAAGRMFGYTAAEMVGRTNLSLLPPDRAGEEAEILARIAKGERLVDFETMRVRKDGRHFPVSVTICPLTSTDGRVVGASKVVRDITERKQAEAALARQLARHSILFDQAADAMCVLDVSRRVVKANASFAKMLGYSEDEVLTLYPWDWDVVYPTKEKLLAVWPELPRNPETFETKFRRKGGIVLDAEVSYTPALWAEETFLFLICRDITERKREQAALQEAEARFEAVVDNLDEGLITCDAEGNLLSWNPAALKIHGFSSPQDPPCNLRDLPKFFELSSMDGAILPVAQRPLVRVLRGEDVRDFETRFRRVGSDRERIFAYSGSTIHDAGGKTLAFLTIKDITERKRAEQSLRQLSSRLLHAQDEERRRLARELHDSTAQTLAAVTINLAQLENAPLNERQKQILTSSQELAQQSVRELRTFSYLLHPPMLDQVGLISGLRQYVEGFEKRSGIKVEVSLPELSKRLIPDVELTIFRIVQEALGNILRHSGSREARIRLTVGSRVRLEVSDTGNGFDAASLDLPGAASSVGVGIAGMKERVQHLCGEFTIESGPRGTIVKVILPIEAHADAEDPYSDRRRP